MNCRDRLSFLCVASKTISAKSHSTPSSIIASHVHGHTSFVSVCVCARKTRVAEHAAVAAGRVRRKARLVVVKVRLQQPRVRISVGCAAIRKCGVAAG